jgi:hypothetical protein
LDDFADDGGASHPVFSRWFETALKRFGERQASSPPLVCGNAEAAKLADAPDLGLRDHPFKNIAFRFKTKSFREGKTAV